MKYNYFYNGQAIKKSEFLSKVPSDWERNLDEQGDYSWGYYKAIQLDSNE